MYLLYTFRSRSPSLREVRNLKAETGSARWLTPSLSLNQLSHTAHDHVPPDAPSCLSRLGLPTPINNQVSIPQTCPQAYLIWAVPQLGLSSQLTESSWQLKRRRTGVWRDGLAVRNTHVRWLSAICNLGNLMPLASSGTYTHTDTHSDRHTHNRSNKGSCQGSLQSVNLGQKTGLTSQP